VLAWDRYAFVNNNPIRYNDPSGHNICDGPLGAKECADARGNAEYYDYLVDKVFEPYPDPEDLYNPDWNTLDRIEGVLSNYEKGRKALFLRYGWEAVDKSGKIHDDLFMSITGAAEFGTLTIGSGGYFEAVEALSNQYYGETKVNTGPMRCFGECNLANQLLWATQMEAWYGNENLVGDYVTNGAWLKHLPSAYLAIQRFAYGADSSWFWGNITEAGLSDYAWVYKKETNTYPGRPYFIVYMWQY
jgi:hypothetical protein